MSNKLRRSRFFPLFALQLVCLFLIGCSTVFAADKYAFILPSLANPYWKALSEGITDGAKEVGITPVILTSTNDAAKEEVLNICQAAISQKPSIIMVCTTTTPIAIKCLQEIQKNGIKSAILDAILTVNDAKKSGVKLSFSIGTNNVMVGQKGADFLVKQTKLKAPKILIIEGLAGNENSKNRVSGFKGEIAKSLPSAKIVSSVSADWDRLKAITITADTLTRNPDLNVVFAANDMMALGAVEAIRSAGKTKDVVVIGVDGVSDARKAILAGRMTASVAQLPYLIGKRSVTLAAESVHGKCSEKTETTPLVVLTKETLESQKEPLLKYVR